MIVHNVCRSFVASIAFKKFFYLKISLTFNMEYLLKPHFDPLNNGTLEPDSAWGKTDVSLKIGTFSIINLLFGFMN